MRTKFAVLVSAGLLAAALPATSASAAAPPRGHYMCYLYDANGYPTLAAGIWILSSTRYAGEGKKNRGRYTIGRRTRKGLKIRFRGGAYGGWWGFYRRVDGTPYIELHNSDGEVGNGCPRASG